MGMAEVHILRQDAHGEPVDATGSDLRFHDVKTLMQLT